MAFASLKLELKKAQEGKYAIPLFDVFDSYSIDGVFESVVNKRAPTILGIYTSFADQPNVRALTAYIRSRAKDIDVPISIMLDHGASVEQCKTMLASGFTDVMYDGSQLPLEQNIINTRNVVEVAHDMGAAVEAELGHVGMGNQYDEFGGKRLGFTDPSIVERFVAETGVDILAIAFGNAHGLYKGEPKLDLELVREVRHKVDIPLVMHGGTGLSKDQFRGAIHAGICKINIATMIVNQAKENIIQRATSENTDYFFILDSIRLAYCDNCTYLYDVFGTTGKVS